MSRGISKATSAATESPHDVRRWFEERLGPIERLWAPRAVRGDDGVASGRRQIDLRGLGGLSVTVECDQFLDIGEAWWRGDPLSFHAPSTSPYADDWLHRWPGGLLTTCGLVAVGPGPETAGGMHGRALGIPAVVTRRGGEWIGDEYDIIVVGIMREAALFSPNLVVERTIRGRIGRPELRIRDVVRNEGFAAVHVRLLYHVNLGWPLTDAGSIVRAQAVPARGASSNTEWTAELSAPRPAAREHVDALTPWADAGGWSRAALRSPAGTEFSICWLRDQLEYVTVWRSIAAGGYAVGLEPGTCWPSHVDAPEYGKRGRRLGPGETLNVELVLAVAEHREDTLCEGNL